MTTTKVTKMKSETEMAPEMPIPATMTTTKVTKMKSFSLMKTLASLLMARRTKAKLVKLMSKMVMNSPLAPMSLEQEANQKNFLNDVHLDLLAVLETIAQIWLLSPCNGQLDQGQKAGLLLRMA